MLGVDKLEHFAVSFGLALWNPSLAFLAGVGKEVYDALRGTVFDLVDLAFDVLGILTAVHLG